MQYLMGLTQIIVKTLVFLSSLAYGTTSLGHCRE
jgi:hypothetical protein